MLLVPNGSPYWRGKADVRLQVAVARVIETGLPIIYANQLGGQDELVFDGASFAINADRSLAFQMPQFEERRGVTTWKRDGGGDWHCVDGADGEDPGDRGGRTGAPACWACATTSTRTAFKASCSACPAASIRRSARRWRSMRSGEERVHCVMMPYRYTSKESLTDAAEIAEALGVRYDIVPIEAPVEGFERALTPLFDGRKPDITEENLQSRARGTILMAISNKFGPMVVTTGNKSEMSVGYATLYGDMNGGFNPIKDLYKIEVYRLSRWRNAHMPPGALGPSGEVIPENIIDQPPTAELRENQKDQDSLPPYDVLDDILECLVEKRDARRRDRRRAAMTRRRCSGSSTCSTSPNTSAARRRPA